MVDNGNGTFTHTAADGTVVTFDANTSTVTQVATSGNVIATHNDGTGNEVQILETLTTIVDNGNGTFTYTDENGDTVIINMSDDRPIYFAGNRGENIAKRLGDTMIFSGELARAADATGANLRVDSDSQQLNLVMAKNLTDLESITLGDTFISSEGIAIDNGPSVTQDGIDAGNTIITNVAPGEISENSTDAINGSQLYQVQQEIYDHSDELVDNGNGTFTHTAADGTVVTFDANTSVVTQVETEGNVIATHDDGAGNVVEIKESITLIGNNAPLTPSERVTAFYINEAGTSFDIFESVTTLIDNGDGTISYQNEAGAIVTIDIAELANTSEVTQVVTAGNTIATHDDGTGTTVDILETITVLDYDDDTKDLTYTDEAGVDTVIGIAATASNGLNVGTGSVTSTDVKLGGDLMEATTITTDATNTLAVAGLVEETDPNLVDIAVVDKVTGVLRTLPVDSLAIEPWNVQTTTIKATENTQNIYQMGTVAIMKDEALADVSLDVEGAVRGGTNQAGTVGANSVAFGDGNIASGANAAAFGTGNIASGANSVAFGAGEGTIDEIGTLSNNEAAGAYSMVMGQANTLWGTGSAVFGNGNQIGTALNEGNWSFVAGLRNVSNSARGYILGMDNVVVTAATGNVDNYIFGQLNTVNGRQNAAIGRELVLNTGHQVAIGRRNAIQTSGNSDPSSLIAATDPVFQVGVGTTSVNLRNAMTILHNSFTGIGIVGTEAAAKPTEMLDIGSEGVRIRDINTLAYEGDIDTDRVVVADATGVLKTLDVADLAATASNGLNIDGTTGDVKLGGDLIEPTVITQAGNTLEIATGGTELIVSDLVELTDAALDDVDGIMVVEADGTVRKVAQTYSATPQNTLKTWTNGDPVYEVVGTVTLATNTNIVPLAGIMPGGSKILSVRFINQATNSISTNIIEYDAILNQVVLGTAGSMTTLHPAGTYDIIVEYVEVP
ncbi:hypothetical protein ACFSKL_22270 [Belliella marina]|uniref:Trimeric autotransporter adhesin YadA-like stalk domain-containing protein n=1 Tax=Belliella marina TaxID=1644146 RepID=A0ABW4VTT1_9BACT